MNKRIRVATTLVAAVAAVTMAAPAPAHASSCNMGKLNELCIKVENLICDLTGRCI